MLVCSAVTSGLPYTSFALPLLCSGLLFTAVHTGVLGCKIYVTLRSSQGSVARAPGLCTSGVELVVLHLRQRLPSAPLWSGCFGRHAKRYIYRLMFVQCQCYPYMGSQLKGHCHACRDRPTVRPRTTHQPPTAPNYPTLLLTSNPTGCCCLCRAPTRLSITSAPTPNKNAAASKTLLRKWAPRADAGEHHHNQQGSWPADSFQRIK